MNIRKKLTGAALATALLGGSIAVAAPALAPAAAASASVAGTIVYVKNHNVWISRPDGSGQRQITKDGTSSMPYFSPAMADNGTIVAGNRGQIVRMRQGGTLLNRFTPRALPTSSGGQAVNLGSLAISPNGTRIAYDMVNTGCTGSGCSTATGYTAADRATDPQFDRSTYFKMPSWAGNGRTLQSGGAQFEIMVHDLGDAPVHWFDSANGLTDIELSPDGRRLAGAAGYQGADGISTYDVVGNAMSGPPPAPPAWRCRWVDDQGALLGPSWGPDSRALAFQATSGVWIVSDVMVSCDAAQIRLVLPGATSPDWSPAPYNPEAQPSVAKRFVLKKKPTISGTARVGKTLRVKTGTWSPTPSSVKVQWTRDGKKITGATKSKYKLKKKDRRHRIAVTVTVKRSGHVTAVKKTSSKRVR